LARNRQGQRQGQRPIRGRGRQAGTTHRLRPALQCD
jgi:hypothetical protein